MEILKKSFPWPGIDEVITTTYLYEKSGGTDAQNSLLIHDLK